MNKKDINLIQLQKMAFIYNALEDGWSIRKKNDLYIFRKDHESKGKTFIYNCFMELNDFLES